MHTFFRHLLTGKDNATYDIVRLLGLLSVALALFLTGWVVLNRWQAWSLQEYGIGLGVLFGALGAALKIKESTEPGP
jgi:hypothetical protein